MHGIEYSLQGLKVYLELVEGPMYSCEITDQGTGLCSEVHWDGVVKAGVTYTYPYIMYRAEV